MSNLITECKELVDNGIQNEFREAEATLVGTGDKRVNLRAPGLVNWLKRLAASGTGPAEEYEGVKYKFISNKDSGTTSPVSSL